MPHTFLTSRQVEEIFEAIKDPGSRLRVLDISCTRLSSVEPEALSSAIGRLVKAKLERCSLSTSRMFHTMRCLFNRCSLTSPQVQALLSAAVSSSSLVKEYIFPLLKHYNIIHLYTKYPVHFYFSQILSVKKQKAKFPCHSFTPYHYQVSLRMGQEKFLDRNLVQQARRNLKELW